MSALAKDYEIISLLGSGTFGKVFKATHKATKTVVAIKLLENCFEDNYNARKVISEIQILRKLSEVPSNVFTTRIFDVIVHDIDLNSKTVPSQIFLVIDYE